MKLTFWMLESTQVLINIVIKSLNAHGCGNNSINHVEVPTSQLVIPPAELSQGSFRPISRNFSYNTGLYYYYERSPKCFIQ
jgi:hypothetical protein